MEAAKEIAPLVQRAQAGDEQALSSLLLLAYPQVLKQCQMVMKHPEDAEDMTQETILRICEKLDTLQKPERFLTWACRIAANLCINERSRHPKDLQFAEDEDGNSFLDDLEDLDRRNIPEEALEDKERMRTVAELIDGLPRAQRECVYFQVIDGYKVKTIAEMTGVSENTVKSRLNYARKALEKGAAEYEEKNGVKLFSLSPLFFLRFAMRQTAAEGLDMAAVDAAVKAALVKAGAAGSAAGAAGSAAVGGASGSAAAASGAAAAKGAAGVLGGMTAKIAAGVLAGAIAVGGVKVAVTGQRKGAETADVPVRVEETVVPPLPTWETPAAESPGSTQVPVETPAPAEEPDPPPAPAQTPAGTPESTQQPDVTPAPIQEPVETPVPTEEPAETPTPTQEPEPTPVPSTDFVIEDGVLVSYTGPGGDVVVPDGVTGIANYVFSNSASRTEITSVTLPAGLTKIGSKAFQGCTGLTRVSLPDGLIQIGSNAFNNCPSLKSLTIPDSVTGLGSSMFVGCTGLTSVTLPAGLTELPPQMFDGCASLTGITLPDSITSIGVFALRGCTSLSSVRLPGGLTLLGNEAFSGCTNLTGVTVPASISYLNGDGFYGCAGLTVYGSAGSYAETWAAEMGYAFAALD